ncbi:MAG: hypothetical protein ABWW63_05440 [Glaciecola sp.]
MPKITKRIWLMVLVCVLLSSAVTASIVIGLDAPADFPVDI